MALTSPKKIALCLFLLVCACSLSAGGVFLFMEHSGRQPDPRENYFRMVHVLQSFGGPACREAEQIPARVARNDDTESLLHHPDKILVLRYLADELAKMHKDHPKAVYYEACARLALGEREKAAALLIRYVVEADYSHAHYNMLCDALHELGDYGSLLLMCSEWQERDPACSPERVRLTWAALYNLGRYDKARAYMQRQGQCLGWEAAVYDAKIVQAVDGEAEAEMLLENALSRHENNSMQIMRLWNILKSKRRV